jgi:hypothetical protein
MARRNIKRAAVKITGAALAALLTMAPADALGQCCGDCNADGVVTIDELLTAVNRALTGCTDDSICASCSAQLASCQTDLADCRVQLGGQRFPASGQTTPFGPGSDGTVRAGAALSYTDNGDGTITDDNTGLIWEKKDHSGAIHDVDNRYSWGMTSDPFTISGTVVTQFLATLNAPPCFAGRCDWRLPNAKELQSIVDYEIASASGPTVNSAFNTNCDAGCTANGTGGLMCSCTANFVYWSSTTGRGVPSDAFVVDFDSGLVGFFLKSFEANVRAVRGGL